MGVNGQFIVAVVIVAVALCALAVLCVCSVVISKRIAKSSQAKAKATLPAQNSQSPKRATPAIVLSTQVTPHPTTQHHVVNLIATKSSSSSALKNKHDPPKNSQSNNRLFVPSPQVIHLPPTMPASPNIHPNDLPSFIDHLSDAEELQKKRDFVAQPNLTGLETLPPPTPVLTHLVSQADTVMERSLTTTTAPRESLDSPPLSPKISPPKAPTTIEAALSLSPTSFDKEDTGVLNVSSKGGASTIDASSDPESSKINNKSYSDPPWWEKTISSDSYRLQRSLTHSSTQPLARRRTRRKSNPSILAREMTKELVLEKQSIDLIDFLRESPDDYYVLQVPPGAWTSGGEEDSDSLDQLTTMSARMIRDAIVGLPPLPRPRHGRRPSFKIDSSLAERSIQEKEAMAVWGDLHMVMRSTLGLECFMAFLVANLGAENLLFFQAVTEITASPSTAAVLTVYDEFIREDAVSMINLRGATHSQIKSEIENVKRTGHPTHRILTLYEVAQREIFRLMENDLFSRFITSPDSDPWKDECRHAVKELYKNQQNKPKLAKSVSYTLLRKGRPRG